MARRATSTSFGGKDGNPTDRGRPGPGPSPETFKQFMRNMVGWTLKARAIDRILKDENHPHFMRALEYATSHGYGKPKESVEISGSAGLTLRVVHE